MRAPAAVLSALVDDEVILHRRSSKPVARRIAESVPAGTVSESFPATVTERVESGDREVSCEPVRRTIDHPEASSRLRTSRYFFGIQAAGPSPRATVVCAARR